MVGYENHLFCSMNQNAEFEQEQRRIRALHEFNLLNTDSVPVFEEAVQMAAHLLNASIVVLGVLDSDRQWFKAALGLSRIGLMNELAASRQLMRQESFCSHVVEQRQVMMMGNLSLHPTWQERLLTQRYGIQAYLGVPLMTGDRHCLGSLEVMELEPRQFTQRDVEVLEMTARWCISEFERNHIKKILATSGLRSGESSPPAPVRRVEVAPAQSPPKEGDRSIRTVKANLMVQMTQELRTPLTSILGMAGVLNREIYGPLTDKQKEYMDIVHNSGQYLLTLVNEVLELGTLDDTKATLSLSSVDVEMLGQQILSTLKQLAQRRDQQLQLTVEPGPRIWVLDKEKVRQMLYHLLFSVIQSSSADSTIRVHVSRKRTFLTITVWTSHPWLGDGLPPAEIQSHPFLAEGESADVRLVSTLPRSQGSSGADLSGTPLPQPTEDQTSTSRKNLGLLLSCRLAEAHGGTITLQGSLETGYRYLVSLPQSAEPQPGGADSDVI